MEILRHIMTESNMIIYYAQTKKQSVTIKTEYGPYGYTKKLSYTATNDSLSGLSQMIGKSFEGVPANKIIKRMIKRLESNYNI